MIGIWLVVISAVLFAVGLRIGKEKKDDFEEKEREGINKNE